ncbi:MAG: hypothetical protein J6U67_05930, partial [Lachnospiraceae bacterium]|nr:hypothetical protein [Lachnospiraceae bacterium]
VFMVHGDDMSAESLAEYVNKEMKIPAYVPYSGTVFNLATGEFEYEAIPEKRKKKIFIVSDAFARLVAAGQRLMAVINKNKDHANKDLAKFTNQINSLCDKWDPDNFYIEEPSGKKSKKSKKKS